MKNKSKLIPQINKEFLGHDNLELQNLSDEKIKNSILVNTMSEEWGINQDFFKFVSIHKYHNKGKYLKLAADNKKVYLSKYLQTDLHDIEANICLHEYLTKEDLLRDQFELSVGSKESSRFKIDVNVLIQKIVITNLELQELLVNLKIAHSHDEIIMHKEKISWLIILLGNFYSDAASLNFTNLQIYIKNLINYVESKI